MVLDCREGERREELCTTVMVGGKEAFTWQLNQAKVRQTREAAISDGKVTSRAMSLRVAGSKFRPSESCIGGLVMYDGSIIKSKRGSYCRLVALTEDPSPRIVHLSLTTPPLRHCLSPSSRRPSRVTPLTSFVWRYYGCSRLRRPRFTNIDAFYRSSTPSHSSTE
jgi:hypothetical protein